MEQRRITDVEVQPPAETPVERENGKRLTKDSHDEMLKVVRASDIEPYTGLGYLSKLFRFMAVIMLLLLVAEIVTGIYSQGAASLPTLLGEASRLIVIAGVLWGTGDLAHLLIDIGHDVRAGRILLARQVHGSLGERAARLTLPSSPVKHDEHSLPEPPPPIP